MDALASFHGPEAFSAALDESSMTAVDYLCMILNREQVDSSVTAPARQLAEGMLPIFQSWAGDKLDGVYFSGSFAKGTANASGTDLDLFVSLKRSTEETLPEIYRKLGAYLRRHYPSAKPRNVAINITVGGMKIDVVPGRRQNTVDLDHSLHHHRPGGDWVKTNIHTHINYVQSSSRTSEIRLLKLWRDQWRLDLPSFNLELTVIEALRERPAWFEPGGDLPANVWVALMYLRDNLATARLVDPANSNNIVSSDMSRAQKQLIAQRASVSLQATDWNQILT